MLVPSVGLPSSQRGEGRWQIVLEVASAFPGSALCRSQLEGGGCAVTEPRGAKQSAQPVMLLPITRIIGSNPLGLDPVKSACRAKADELGPSALVRL